VLTPLDIHNQEFRVVLRGYSQDEVDDFLDRVVADFEALLKQNAEFKEELDDLRERVEQYRQLETTLHNALVVAQGTAEEVKENARKEAQLIIREAEDEAVRRTRGGEARLRELDAQVAQAHREAQAFRAQVRSQLEAQLEIVRRDIPPPDGRGRGVRLPEQGSAGDTQVATSGDS
jgi:cell division initiation protein